MPSKNVMDLLDGLLGELWKSDFNDRERERYAKAWRTTAVAAHMVADGLLTKEDKAIFKGALLFMSKDDELKEMMRTVMEQITGDKGGDTGSAVNLSEQLKDYVGESEPPKEAAPEPAADEPPKPPIEMPASSIEDFPGQDLENSTLG